MEDPEAQEFSEVLAPALQGLANDLLAERGGGMATAFIGLVNYIDAEGQPNWSFVVSDGQPISQSAGIARVLDKIIDQQLDEAMFGD